MKRNWFTLGILAMIALAFFPPGGSALNGGSRIAAYLAGQPEVLGNAVLPIVFYHPWQLLVCGIARGMFLRTRRA